MKTIAAQLEKLSARFGRARITMVGDRGMIKGPQTVEMKKAGIHYITAIIKPQIEKLLRAGTLQMELFDEDVSEAFGDDGEPICV